MEQFVTETKSVVKNVVNILVRPLIELPAESEGPLTILTIAHFLTAGKPMPSLPSANQYLSGEDEEEYFLVLVTSTATNVYLAWQTEQRWQDQLWHNWRF